MSFQEDTIALAAQKFPKYTTDEAWMRYLYFQPWDQLEKYGQDGQKALLHQLDLYAGDAFGAFVQTHDNGFGVMNYLRHNKDDKYLMHPLPPDPRYAIADEAVQVQLMARGLDAYGNPRKQFHADQADENWGVYNSNQIVQYKARAVPPLTAKWLIFNGFVAGIADENAWNPYRGLGIAAACVKVESVNHPWNQY